MTTTDRQPAYDATYGLIRRLGNHLPASTALRNAAIWRAVEVALDATGVPTRPAADQQPIDLDAIRERASNYDESRTSWQAHDLAADVPALAAEVERLRAELAMWRDDVSAQWHDECIRLQGEVERLTREQLNADIAATGQPEAGAQ